MDVFAKSEFDSDLYRRILLYRNSCKRGRPDRLFFLRVERFAFLDSLTRIPDSRYRNFNRQSTPDQTISLGSGNFSMDSFFSVRITLADYGRAGDRLSIMVRESKLVGLITRIVDDRRDRFISCLSDQLFRSDQYNFKGYFSPCSPLFTIPFLGIAGSIPVVGSFRKIECVESVFFPLELFRSFILSNYESKANFTDFVPFIVLFFVIFFLSRAKLNQVVLDHL